MPKIQKVRHPENGIGIIVPDPMNMCTKGNVMVNFDGGNLRACHIGDLKSVEELEVEFDVQRCKGCVFSSSSECQRHHNGYLGWLLSSSKKHVPTRIYPHCREEISQMREIKTER